MNLAASLECDREACIAFGSSTNDDANPAVTSDCGNSRPPAATSHPDFAVPPQIGHQRADQPSVPGTPD